MNKENVRKTLIVSGIILALCITFNVKNSKMHEETTVVATLVEEFGSSWYVDENRLDKSFKHGVWNPETGDSIGLKLDSEGRVIAWKVKK